MPLCGVHRFSTLAPGAEAVDASPPMEAMSVMGPFEGFLLLTGKVLDDEAPPGLAGRLRGMVRRLGEPVDELLDRARRIERVRIPIAAGGRSLNLANAAAIGVYEAWRQLGFDGGR